MSRSSDEGSNSNSSGTDEPENYESNDADSVNFDEEEESNGTAFPLPCNLPDSLVRGSIVLRIDQTHGTMSESVTNRAGGTSRIGSFPFTISIMQGPIALGTSTTTATTAPTGGTSGGQGDASSSVVEGISPSFLQAGQSVSRTTSLSDAASDNMSTRAVMGDASSTNGNSGLTLDDDGADNSSQASLADSEADRVRRIHNSIFSSLENDLAELVRIREETIQFLENGSRSRNSTGNENNSSAGDTGASTSNQENINPQSRQDANSNSNSSGPGPGEGTPGSSGAPPSAPRNATQPQNDGNNGNPFILRERLTFHTRPFRSFHETFPSIPRIPTTMGGSLGGDPNTITMNGRSFTPIAKFDNAPPAMPSKPNLETGLKCCDEKAAAARKVLDKLLYGDPEDESACFVRRFWRETSTQDAPPPIVHSPSPISLDIAAMAERTATLEATLEEAFDSIRLRLQQAAAESSGIGTASTSSTQTSSQNRGDAQQENESRERDSNNNNGESNGSGGSNNEPNGSRGSGRLVEPNSVPYYQSWDEETSIMNNPLNYDIWNELEDGNDAGPTITVRINLAERRANAVNRIRTNERPSNSSGSRTTTSTREVSNANANNNARHTSTGTDTAGPMEGAELDDESTDDEEISNYFRFRASSILNGRHAPDNSTASSTVPSGRVNLNAVQSLSEESREFFREIGIPEELGRDLFNMFTFSTDEVSIPPEVIGASSTAQHGNEGSIDRGEVPEPLFPRIQCFTANVSSSRNRDGSNHEPSTMNLNDSDRGLDESHERYGEANEDTEENVHDSPSQCPQIPLLSAESGFEFEFDPHQDDCSSRVYLDENNLNFPYELNEDSSPE